MSTSSSTKGDATAELTVHPQLGAPPTATATSSTETLVEKPRMRTEINECGSPRRVPSVPRSMSTSHIPRYPVLRHAGPSIGNSVLDAASIAYGSPVPFALPPIPQRSCSTLREAYDPAKILRRTPVSIPQQPLAPKRRVQYLSTLATSSTLFLPVDGGSPTVGARLTIAPDADLVIYGAPVVTRSNEVKSLSKRFTSSISNLKARVLRSGRRHGAGVGR
ncbi:hypothetical protein P280DRAFT_471505 [Massarina eburnea CBS 473.64]|uniref:Uncharacterized protein n=1 Tax=Massarina eburnea CBS 473.64 TaxID=1395130 RepID=A0A6A6RVG7_9PLEO|nr:hypothetical protein P280DRAFT_471505 [Massarina eburnea CBS 473.64]